jgi:hypothetical protein
MYTPAEEIGLMGLRLATRVQNALDRIPPETMADLLRNMQRTATARHLAYQRDGVTETIRLLPARSPCGRTSSATRTTSRKRSSTASSAFPISTSTYPPFTRSFGSLRSKTNGSANAGRRHTAS